MANNGAYVKECTGYGYWLKSVDLRSAAGILVTGQSGLSRGGFEKAGTLVRASLERMTRSAAGTVLTENHGVNNT